MLNHFGESRFSISTWFMGFILFHFRFFLLKKYIYGDGCTLIFNDFCVENCFDFLQADTQKFSSFLNYDLFVIADNLNRFGKDSWECKLIFMICVRRLQKLWKLC